MWSAGGEVQPCNAQNLPCYAGGAGKFLNQELDRDYLPVWLQALGYSTYFTGKFLNGFDDDLAETNCPR